MSDAEVHEAIEKLGPWSIDIQVTPGVRTGKFVERAAGGSSTKKAGTSPHDVFIGYLTRIFPDGLAGRSFLDIGSDCGAYAFFAKEAGAGHVYGFDTDSRTIEQAQFLQSARTVAPTEDMTFARHDVRDLADQDIGQFDITRLSRIFNRVADPIAALELAAERTRQLIIVNAATPT